MRRREFITLVGGAAAWPLAVRAQPAKLPTIGFLGPGTSSIYSQWTAAFVQRLRELGWIEGRTVAIEYRWADGRTERFAEIAAEFVRLKVDVIVTAGSAVPAAMQATSTIPIVFAVAADPLGSWPGREPGATGRQRHWPVDPIGRCCWQEARTVARSRPGPPQLGDHWQCWLPLSFPKIPSVGICMTQENLEHHPTRCLPSSTCFGPSSPTCSSPLAGLKSRTFFFGIRSILPCGVHRTGCACVGVTGVCWYG